jgi:tetratricopeptide (TPR) repeat protein
VEPGGAIVAAAHLATGEAGAGGDLDLDAIDARMAIAWQSFLAGSVDHGIDLGRSVVAMADRGDDVSLQIMARLFLAAKLSIAVRGWDEGAASTTQALRLAEQSDRAYEEANARSVLAGIDLMRAEYPAAAAHATIGAARCSDAGTRALNLAFLAAVEADTGKGAEAVGHALEAVAAAEESHDPVPIAYATAYAGHALLLQGDLDGARPHVERAVEVLAPIHVLLPWPLAILGEIEARAGRLEAAERHAARAGAVAATTDIAYQRALALRVEALVAEAQGETAFALDRLEAALGHARRTTGEGYSFHWPIAWILESLATISGRIDRGAARRWTDALLDHATATGMVTFVRRGEALAAADAAAVSGRP